VTSWGTGFQNTLITAGTAPSKFNLKCKAGGIDVTRFVSGGTATFERANKGLREIDFTIECQLASPQLGNSLSVAYSSGYVANVKEFDISISADAKEATVSTGSQVLWRNFIPTIVRTKGSWSCFLDDTTGPSAVALAAEPASATFTLITGGTGKNLALNIITTDCDIAVSPADINTVKYNFMRRSVPSRQREHQQTIGRQGQARLQLPSSKRSRYRP